MAKTKPGISIGSPSLILIFMIMCLATFSLLSLSSAAGALKLAEKNADAVRGYYQADREGERFVQAVVQGEAAPLQEAGDKNRQQFWTEIPMEFEQVLQVGLSLDEAGNYRIEAWKVYNQEDYEIDDTISVWGGNTINE